jgi:hypothetical protein
LYGVPRIGGIKGMKLEVRKEFDEPKWEEYLRLISSPPFFAPSWIECFENKTRRPIYLHFIAEGKTLGLAAGLSVEPPNVLLRKFFRMLYFFSGPAVVDADKDWAKMCLSKMISFARENRYTHIKVGSLDYPYAIDGKDLPVLQPWWRKEYIVDLQANPAGLKKKLKKRMTDVRGAERNGLCFYEGRSPRMLDELLLLLDETKSIRMSKRYKNYAPFYIPYLDKQILYKLLEKGIARIFYVKKQEDILNVELTVAYNGRAYGLLCGTNQMGYQLRANSLLQFNILQKLKSEGFEIYNFGGIPTGPGSRGLALFKTSFGGIEHVCTGWRSHHLQSPFIDRLTNAYLKFPEMKITKIIRKRFTGRNYV